MRRTLADSGAIGVAIRIKQRLIRPAVADCWRLCGDSAHEEVGIAATRFKDGWRARSDLGDFVIRGMPQHAAHGRTIVLDAGGSELAELVGVGKLGSHTIPQSVRLLTDGLAIDFVPNTSPDASAPTFVTIERGASVGGFWMHSASAGTLELPHRREVDLRVAAAACIDLHCMLASTRWSPSPDLGDTASGW